MKRIILALIAAMTLCSLVQAKNRTVTENDSLGNKKRVIELRDTTIDGKTVTDTLSIMTYEGSSSDSKSDKGWKHHNGSGWDWDFDLDGKTSETIISVTAIVFIFGLPRVMHHLPNRYYRISQLWSLFCFTLAVVLFFVLDGLQLVLGALRETFTSAIQSGAAELDPKSLIIVAVVLVYLGYRKICSLA